MKKVLKTESLNMTGAVFPHKIPAKGAEAAMELSHARMDYSP
jgi:hypothetical protein